MSGLRSVNKFPKIFPFIYRRFGTIWNSLEPFWRCQIHSAGFRLKFRVFQKNGVTSKILLRIRYDSSIGILRPFGTISEVFEKSFAKRSAEESVITCFPESELPDRVKTWSEIHLTKFVIQWRVFYTWLKIYYSPWFVQGGSGLLAIFVFRPLSCSLQK